ncbi:MAG TPA: hypothetical protein VGB78_05690 [Thermoplasmata archaeon]
MGVQQEGSARRKVFQRTTDEESDAFLSKKSASNPASAPGSSQQPQTAQRESPPAREQEAPKTQADAEKQQQADIEAIRNSRASLEAAHDVALLRKKAHAAGHKAAKYFHKHKSDEAKAQKLVSKAYAHREKASGSSEIAEDLGKEEKNFEAELAGAASGSSGLSPEAIRDKMANLERKAAKQRMVAQKHESKAASLTEKAAKYRTRSAKSLEQSKVQEFEQKQYAKRADILERAGT